MIADTEIGVGSEELSITEASLEFGLSEALLRKVIHSGRLAFIAHRWRQRVRWEDVAKLDEVTQAQASRPISLPKHQPPTRKGRGVQLERVVLVVQHLGEASASEVQQHLIEDGEPGASYRDVGTVLRELTKKGKLEAHRERHRLLYRLQGAEDGHSASHAANAPP